VRELKKEGGNLQGKNPPWWGRVEEKGGKERQGCRGGDGRETGGGRYQKGG